MWVYARLSDRIGLILMAAVTLNGKILRCLNPRSFSGGQFR